MAALSTAFGIGGGATPAGALSAVVTNYAGLGNPAGITTGPDGALWFTEGGPDAIGRMTTGGTVTTFTDPSLDLPDQIVTGPDGALWFTNIGNNTIGRITTGGTITHYGDPTISAPLAIISGSGNALWFVNSGSNTIGRITTGGVVSNFSDSHMHLGTNESIAAGSDGALWFVNVDDNSIGRLTSTGAVSYFTHSNIHRPWSIVAGPDGALWFTNLAINLIGRITTTGALSFFVIPSYDGGNITVGPDGALWFTINGPDFQNARIHSIERITTAGADAVYSDGSITAPGSITAGSDGGVWFTNTGHPSIGRIALEPTIVPGVATVAEGNSGTTNLDVPVTLSEASTQTVTAQWRTVSVPGAPGDQADPGSDYTPVSGTVTFTPGQTAQTVSIPVRGDTVAESGEYVVVQFGNPVDASVGGFWGLGFGVIANDDGP